MPLLSKRSREPILNLPGVVTAFLIVLVGVHLWRLWFLSEQTDDLLVFDYALIPARWSLALLPDGLNAVEEALRRSGGADLQWQMMVVQFLVNEAQFRPWTAISHIFLHGSWLHLIFNSVWFAAFGTPLARRWGSGLFLVFCLFCATFGALGHYVSQPYSVVPTIGASGIVSGMFGAAAWYVFNAAPGRGHDLSLAPRLSFHSLIRNPTVLTFIIFWLIGNYVVAVTPGAFVGEHTEIAWQAHVGGFLGGFLFFPFIDDHRRKSENQ